MLPFIALWILIYTINTPPRRLHLPVAWRLAKAVGLASLIAFTSVTVALAVVAGEAVIFYHEPSPIVWGLEVALGVYGVVIGLRELLKLC